MLLANGDDVTGLRICSIKMFPVANMCPALLWAMPLSRFGTIFEPTELVRIYDFLHPIRRLFIP